MRSAQQIGQNGLGQSGPRMPQVPVEQKVPLINDDAKDKDQESESSTTADEESIDEESTDEESTEEKTKESMVIPNEVAKPKPVVKSEKIYTEEDVKNLKDEIAFTNMNTGFLIFLLVAVGCLFFGMGMGMGYYPKCSWEKSILSEKIIVAKELMKLQGMYHHSKLQQVVDVLDYDFVHHGVIENIKEEELIKAIFKHSYNDPLAMNKLMNLECHDEHTRIYILAKCSKGNTVDDIAVQCKFLYEKCGII